MRSVLLASLLSVLLLSACTGERLRQANVDLVAEGMSKKQVESILGPPTSIDAKNFLMLKRTTYIYTQANGSVTILFKGDKVEAKSSTLTK